MNWLKDFKLKWWQVSLFKLSLITFGLAVGAYFSQFFINYVLLLLIIAFTSGGYIFYVWLKQR